MISFLKTIIYVPLYNLLMVILNTASWVDVGIAVIMLTVFVKIILYPLAKKTSITQFQMKERQPELDALKEKHKDNKEELALKTLEFYKKYKINPFSSFFVLLLQIPIIYSLYHIFLHAGLPVVDNNLLYSFIKAPESISMKFLGLVDISNKNIFFAFFAGISSFFQMKIAAPATPGKMSGEMKDDLAKIMSLQMKYFMPILVFFISWKISAVVALYWATSNILGIVQDLWIKKKLGQVKSIPS